MVTTGCNYRFHAVPPNKLEGTVDIVCAAGKEIKVEVEGIAGCIISTPFQTALGKLEYRNEPTGKVTVKSEVSNIRWKATSACSLSGLEGTNGVYREGEIVNVGGVEVAKMAPAGKSANGVSEGFVPGTAEPIPVEVGINQAHWYANGVALPKQSGGPGEEGTDVISWGTLVLTTVTLGVIECENEFGGDVYNPEGNGGNAKVGEAKMDSFAAYDCTDAECETTLNSKLTIEAEGLGVVVVGGKAEYLEWEAQLETVAGVNRLKVGNTTGNEKTRIKFHIVCPKTTTGEFNSKAKGELTPEVENGSAIGSAPGTIIFGAGSGELEIGTTKEGKVTGKLKAMGYEGGEIIAGKRP